MRHLYYLLCSQVEIINERNGSGLNNMVTNHQDGNKLPPRVELDVRFILEQLGIDSELAIQRIFKDHSAPTSQEEKKK